MGEQEERDAEAARKLQEDLDMELLADARHREEEDMAEALRLQAEFDSQLPPRQVGRTSAQLNQPATAHEQELRLAWLYRYA